MAPDPSSAPVPPAAWVKDEPPKPSLSSISQSLQNTSISTPQNGSSVPLGFSRTEPPVRNPVPHQQRVVTPMSQPQRDLVGRGRGIMETVDPSLKLPKGRGYAPPGMDVQRHLQLLQFGN